MRVKPPTIFIFSFIFKVYNLGVWRGVGIRIGDLEMCQLYTTRFSFTQETQQAVFVLGCSPSRRTTVVLLVPLFPLLVLAE